MGKNQTNRQYLDKDKDSSFVSISDEFQKRFNTLFNVLAFVIVPNIAEADTNEMGDIKDQLDKLLDGMEAAGLSVGAAKVASLAVFLDRVANIEQYIQQVSSSYNKSDIDEVILGIWVLLVMKHRGISFDIDPQHWITYIIEHVKCWLSPSLYSALRYLKRIISKMPEYVSVGTVNILLPALGVLADKTNLTNKKSQIVTESNRLACRREAMGLASAMFKYFENQSKPQPPEILKWKEIAESPEEFWEIRNMWTD